MPNLIQFLSIFLKLQAVKQSGPGFFAYPVYIAFAYAGEERGIFARIWAQISNGHNSKTGLPRWPSGLETQCAPTGTVCAGGAGVQSPVGR